MTRIEIALEVGAINAPPSQRLKDAGFDVYQGEQSWRVVAQDEADRREHLHQGPGHESRE